MKILNKLELQQIAINHLFDIDLKNLINLYKKCTAKSYSFLVNDTTFAQKILYVLDAIFKREYNN